MRAAVACLLIVLVGAALLAVSKLGIFARSAAQQDRSSVASSQEGAMTSAEAKAVLQDWTFPGASDVTAQSKRAGLVSRGIAGRVDLGYRVLISKAPFAQISSFYRAKCLSGPTAAFPDRLTSGQLSGILPSEQPVSWMKNGVKLQACGYSRNTARYSIFASISSMDDGKRSRIYLTFAPIKPLISR